MRSSWLPTRRKRFILIILSAFISLSFISHNLYFNRDRWMPTEDFAHEPYNHTAVHETVTENPPRILLVSAMFPLSKSKHSLSDYEKWLKNFIAITTPIYLFMPESLASSILPDPLPPNLTLNTSYSNPFDVPILSGLQETYEEQWTIDREKDRHGSELYAIWNAKPWLLEQGMKNSDKGEGWDHVFWTDAGSFRKQHHYTAWPAPGRVNRVWEEVGEKEGEEGKIFFPIFETPRRKDKWWKEEDGPLDEDISEGSFFGGSPSAVSWYKAAFYAYHDYYLSSGYFIGKDQSIINALMLLFPNRFISVYQDDPHAPAYIHPSSPLDHLWWRHIVKTYFSSFAPSRALGKCGVEWYYYQFFFGQKEEREWMWGVWNQEEDGWDRWLGGSKDAAEKENCRMTSAVRFDEVLRRKDVYGDGWRPSRTTVTID